MEGAANCFKSFLETASSFIASLRDLKKRATSSCLEEDEKGGEGV